MDFSLLDKDLLDPSKEEEAYMNLFKLSEDDGIDHLLTYISRVFEWNETSQLAVLKQIKKKIGKKTEHKDKYGEMLNRLIKASSTEVKYECACLLSRLSTKDEIIAYCDILLSEKVDNKVKVKVLDRLAHLKLSQPDSMVYMAAHILHVLPILDIDSRRKTLEIVIGVLREENVDEILDILRKEFVNIHGEYSDEYRKMVMTAIYCCAVDHPKVLTMDVVKLLMEFLGDNDYAMCVVYFLDDTIRTNMELRHLVITQLLEKFNEIQEPKVCSYALWLIGEYCPPLEGISTIKNCLGELPLSSQQTVPMNNLRSLVIGHTFIRKNVASTLTKLVMRSKECEANEAAAVHNEAAAVPFIMVSMLHLFRPYDEDSTPENKYSVDIIELCLKVVCNTGYKIMKMWQNFYYDSMCNRPQLKPKPGAALEETGGIRTNAQSSPKDLIRFSQLQYRKDTAVLEVESEADHFQKCALEFIRKDAAKELCRISNLTTNTAPVHAEAKIAMTHEGLILYVTLINGTKETVRALYLYANTYPNIILDRLGEQPSYHVDPQSTIQIQKKIRMESTEASRLSGFIFYDALPDRPLDWGIPLDISIDISDYMTNGKVNRKKFHALMLKRDKVQISMGVINTTIEDAKEFIDHILDVTNLKGCEIEDKSKKPQGIVCAFIFAITAFKKRVLVNVTVKTKEIQGRLTGHIEVVSEEEITTRRLMTKIKDNMG